jgi:hypothetical protein
MVQSRELVLNSAQEVHEGSSSLLRDIGAGKLAVVALCALGGTLAGNAIYDFVVKAQATYALMEKTQPSASYLNATRSPAVDYALLEQVSWEFNEAVDDAAIPAMLAKADQCWMAYDAAPNWSQFDHCVGYDIGLRSYATPRQIQAHAQQSGYPSVADRKAEGFLVSKSEALGGELIVVQRANDIAMTIQINNRQ